LQTLTNTHKRVDWWSCGVFVWKFTIVIVVTIHLWIVCDVWCFCPWKTDTSQLLKNYLLSLYLIVFNDRWFF